ncbi:MAG: DUF494 family protein [Gammaproteobacteria bacterium]
MKENMLDVLMYLFEYYLEDGQGMGAEQENIHLALEDAGFGQKEIDKAFNWLEGLTNDGEASFTEVVPQSSSMRLYSKYETEKLGDECRGFILFLEQMAVLTPRTRELVIDRALALEVNEIDLEELKWVIVMVLFNKSGKEENNAWIENLVFDDSGIYLH